MGAGPAIQKGTGSSGRVFLLLLKSFIGTGVLFLSSAFRDGGFAFSVAMLLLLAILITVGMMLLVWTSEVVPGSFEQIGDRLFGKPARWLVLASVGISQFGFGCAYCLFVAKNASELVRRVSNDAVLLGPWVFILIQMGIYLPLVTVRRMENFAILSIMGNAFVLFGLGVVSVAAISHMVSAGGVAKDIVMLNADRFPLFIGTSIYTFEGIGLVIPMKEACKEPKKFGMILCVAMVITTAIYVFVAAVGYLSWGAEVQTIVLFNLDQNALSSTIYALYIWAIVFTFPITVTPTMQCLDKVLFSSVLDIDPDVKPVKPASGMALWSPRKLFWIQNVSRWAVVVCIGMVAYFAADALDKLVSIVGSFGCVPLSFCYPAAFHLRAFPNQGLGWKLLDWAFIVVGFGAMLFVTIQTFRS
ncbi:hypothetical protein AMAG_07235 [Allomyces macrogynus ATCC 38327]|uniref:Amino acid transporter transmembrane domain-containing protein n=1 Tax=Allomyces macrogynus (strain ATCC 38327) TaxID=578462 RepID=A0A0L0SHL0_ALLM3|nr:hypothetical protein AMAG_07235 [Allomyces macrogynus ATCC 38327]|eukprot:KNE61971.1 hypothetical protein AMAG_07235 [Allomyces macrogynus ATCC 38327]